MLLQNIELLAQEFKQQTNWQDKYKLLIKCANSIEKPSETELAQMQQISGCENEVWFTGKQIHGYWQFATYSEARIMRGILAIILLSINGKTSAELINLNMPILFTDLGIASNLTSTRLKSIDNISNYIKKLVSEH